MTTLDARDKRLFSGVTGETEELGGHFTFSGLFQLPPVMLATVTNTRVR